MLYRWRFALILAGLMIAFELVIMAVIISGTPPGQRWLGATIFNSGDMPVYLNYLAQAQNSFLLSNLFNNLPQIQRFDAFWSLGGILVRLGLTPLWTHEILRWICTLILAFAVFATARSVTRTEKQTRIASLFMISGLSAGWLYDLWIGLNDQWTRSTPAIADLASEFAIAPVLLGGAHMILSLALQLLAARWIWEAVAEANKARLWPSIVILLFLSFFHPYFIPLYGLIALLAFCFGVKSGHGLGYASSFLRLCAALVPGAVYYLWLTLNDAAFRAHHFRDNFLPIDPWYFWLVMLLPFVPAAVFLAKHKVPETYRPARRPVWVWVWLASAVICMLLPFPWTRKYTQGLLPALVLLTLPFWLMLADRLWNKVVIWPLKICLMVLLAFPFIHLLLTQAFMITDPYWQKSFYRPEPIFRAWSFIRANTPPDSLVVTTDLWSNHWTPAFTLRRMWVGHKHETPDFADRIGPYREWSQTQDQEIFRSYLASTPVTHVIATTATDTERVVRLIDPRAWRPVFGETDAAVWQRK